MACSEAAKAVAYYRYLLEELGFLPPGPTSLSMENKAGIDLAYQPRAPQADQAHRAAPFL